MSHVESHHDHAYKAGQPARFEGESVDKAVSGGFDVKVLDPHSNKHEVNKVEGKGKRARAYNKQGHSHLPKALVERPEYTRKSDNKVVPARQFEVHHHYLRGFSQHSEEGVEQFGEKTGHIYTATGDDKSTQDLHTLIGKHGGKHVESNIHKLPKSKLAGFKKEAQSLGFHQDRHWGHYTPDEGEFSQHEEAEPTPTDWEALIAQGPVGTQRW